MSLNFLGLCFTHVDRHLQAIIALAASQAHCILDIVPEIGESSEQAQLGSQGSAHTEHTALAANVVLTPGMAPASHLVEMAWAGTQEHSSRHQHGTQTLPPIWFSFILTVHAEIFMSMAAAPAELCHVCMQSRLLLRVLLKITLLCMYVATVYKWLSKGCIGPFAVSSSYIKGLKRCLVSTLYGISFPDRRISLFFKKGHKNDGPTELSDMVPWVVQAESAAAIVCRIQLQAFAFPSGSKSICIS